MPATILSHDEDFEEFGKDHAFSNNNHHQDRYHTKTPSEMQPFCLAPAQSAHHYLLNSYELHLLPEEHDCFVVQDKILYLSKDQGEIHYTIITPAGNMVYGSTYIGASADFSNKEAMMRFKDSLLTKSLAEDTNPLPTVFYEGIPCVTYTQASTERELAASNLYSSFVTRFNVPEGSVGLISNQGRKQFVAPGNHILFEQGLTFLKTEKTTNRLFSHGNIHVVLVHPGELYFVKSVHGEKDDFKLLTPGRHVFELSDAIILPVINPHGLEVKVQLSDDELRTLFVKVPQGKAGILEDQRGELSILPPGVTYVNATSKFHTRISSKTCIIELPIKGARTKDNIKVEVDARVYYRIKSPYHAILQLGMNEYRRRRTDPRFAPENIEEKIRAATLLQMKLQINSLITLKQTKAQSQRAPTSFYDAVFNAQVVSHLNKALNTGNVTGYLEISKVSIVNIKISDPQIKKDLEKAMAKAILDESRARVEDQMAPFQKQILSKTDEIAAKKAMLERLKTEYQRTVDQGKKECRDIQQSISAENARLLRDNPKAREVYELDSEKLQSASQCADSFFHSKPEQPESLSSLQCIK